MGFYNPRKRDFIPSQSSQVAFSVLESSLGVWHDGYSRRNPEIHVEMITQITRNIRQPSRLWVWLKRLGGWLRLL